MKTLRSSIVAALAAVVLDAAFGMPMHGGLGVASADSSSLTGSITVEMHETYSAPGITGSTICSATLTLAGDGTTSATERYTHDWQQIRQEGENVSTTTTMHQEPLSGGSFSNVTAPYLNIDTSSGTYVLAFYLPTIPLKTTTTTQTTGQQATTDVNTTSYTGQCPDASSGYIGSTPVRGKLTGSAQLSGTVQAHGDFDQSGGNGTVTVTWSLRDLTLQQTTATPQGSTGPTGKIKVTNNGIEATLDWKGWELSYAGDWKAAQKQPSSPPTISSPDQRVTITLQEQPVSGQPSTATTQATIRRTASATGRVGGISYKPFTIGALTGQIGVVTFATSPDTLLVAVVSDGQRQLITQTLVKPNTPPVDLLEAGIAIGSLHQTG